MNFKGLYKGSHNLSNINILAPTIHFEGKDNVEIMRLEPNGDIFVHGNMIENDKEVVKGMRHFLESHGY